MLTPAQLGLTIVPLNEPQGPALSILRTIACSAIARKCGHDCVVIGCAAYVACKYYQMCLVTSLLKESGTVTELLGGPDERD